MAYRSLTEQIYLEIMEGVEKKVDWNELLDKYRKSKGPFYNAFSRALPQLRARCEKLFAEISQGEEKRKELDKDIAQSEERKRELDQAVNNTDARLKKLEEAEAEASERLSSYDEEIQGKKAMASSLTRVEESGFSPERLEELGKKVDEIGTGHGLSPDEAMSKFFDDLKLWSEKLGLEVEVQRLSSTKKQIEDSLKELEKRYRRKKAAIEMLEELREEGVGTQRIQVWNITARSAGVEVEELHREIEKWGNLREANRAEEEKKKKLSEEIARAEASLQEVELRKAEVEGAIGGVAEEAVNMVRAAGQKAKDEIARITLGIKGEIHELHSEALKVGEEVGRIEKALPSKKEVKNLFDFITSPHLVSKDSPVLFSVTSSLLEWLKNNEGKIPASYSLQKELERLKGELSK